MQPISPATDVKRFTTQRKNVRFFVDDDEFFGIPALPAMDALNLTQLQTKLSTATTTKEKFELVPEVFSEFMLPESFALFTKRLSDKTNPIDISTLMDVMQWLLGDAYGLRPTQPPSSSEPGRSVTGTNLTDGAQHELSTQPNLPGIDSSTSSITT